MRVAIIGLGEVSSSHIGGLLANGQEIVAVCDIIYQKCQRVNEFYSLNASCYTDYKEMIDNERIDCVHVCTPHYLHAPMIVYALSKNVNVFTEKPLAISKEQLLDIEKAVKSSTAQLGVCQQNRYNKSTKYVLDFIKDKKVLASSGQLVWCRDKSYYSRGEWRGKWATEGGGVMINQALHTLDLLMLFTGFPKSVTASISNNSLKGVIEVEDTAFGLFECENGANFVMNATNASKYTFPVQIALATSEHKILIDGQSVFIDGELVDVKCDEIPLGKECWGAGHAIIIKDFYKKLQSGEKFELDFYEAQKVVKLILAMYESKGEKINVEL